MRKLAILFLLIPSLCYGQFRPIPEYNLDFHYLASAYIHGAIYRMQFCRKVSPRKTWTTNQELAQIVLIAQDYAEQNNIDPPIILGLMWTESKMQPHLVHGKDGGSPSYGLGQLKYKYMHKVWPQCAYLTADPKLGPKHLLIPEINICLIAAILNKHRRRYGSRALTVYNCGPKRCKHMKREPRAVHAYWRHAKWMRREGESQLAKLPPLISDTDIFVMPRDIPKEPVVK